VRSISLAVLWWTSAMMATVTGTGERVTVSSVFHVSWRCSGRALMARRGRRRRGTMVLWRAQ
jgi:hypothetical protein